MPLYSPGSDPGPNFHRLVDDAGLMGPRSDRLAADVDITHATTCVAVRYADGVIMAGDRRATAGNLISHRDMEKVYPADRFSGVAIAGAAGPAMEMVRLFQLQLEHYEKVEGNSLSLEGKANQLSMMVRNHLPMAMQGMVVVPLFAGFDKKRSLGRLFEYDVTGGRYEEKSFASTGSGSLFAETVVKMGYRDELSEDDAVDLVLSALFQAADQDSATGGPDAIRGIYPIIATISGDGFAALTEDDIAGRFEALIERLLPSSAAPGADVAPRGARS